MILDANGNIPQALCSRCGASLKHVFFFNGKPVGSDCFARLTGLKVEWMAGYIDSGNHIDYDRYLADQAAVRSHAANAAETRRARVALVAGANAWLIDELLPYSEFVAGPDRIHGQNFAGSIVIDLRDSGTLATDLPDKAKGIIVDMLTRGLRGKSRASAQNALIEKLFLEK